MEIMAYLASVLIGISLGLVGGGGSILTVPVLVYLFGVPPLLSTSYSLFIVGSTSLIGAIRNYKNGLLNVRTALLFGATSVTTVFLVRKFLIPQIPNQLFELGDFQVTEPILTMALFGVLMIAASVGMIKDNTQSAKKAQRQGHSFFKLFAFGTGIGLTTGLLGAGGGFLLIPTLVLLLGMPMKEAVGTSLLIIALNSLIGFAGDLGHFQIYWGFLLTVTSIAIAGLFLGGLIGNYLNVDRLKRGFGWFVLVMGAYIIIHEFI
ncbi:sulfite exporter TauE/SafE family protein [Dyadobacter sandarakinus]|uniref:Probable membrane transporter protein n=1 Tax=Dyadobacter sandarakinus TaxID=2747268 RepID=A0ABX7I6Z9_9BACT|nr:sulfite exporter TauE/SafE family protein [Dyadobacter sandarakinus]QRR01613.1 sulfite exporter TauE/SafE family protein [Dyadobacter sandarakinus]